MGRYQPVRRFATARYSIGALILDTADGFSLDGRSPDKTIADGCRSSVYMLCVRQSSSYEWTELMIHMRGLYWDRNTDRLRQLVADLNEAEYVVLADESKFIETIKQLYSSTCLTPKMKRLVVRRGILINDIARDVKPTGGLSDRRWSPMKGTPDNSNGSVPETFRDVVSREVYEETALIGGLRDGRDYHISSEEPISIIDNSSNGFEHHLIFYICRPGRISSPRESGEDDYPIDTSKIGRIGDLSSLPFPDGVDREINAIAWIPIDKLGDYLPLCYSIKLNQLLCKRLFKRRPTRSSSVMRIVKSDALLMRTPLYRAPSQRYYNPNEQLFRSTSDADMVSCAMLSTLNNRPRGMIPPL